MTPHEKAIALEFGRVIREVRTELGLTQAELAEKIGSAQQTVARYETGNAKASIDYLAKVCELIPSSTIEINLIIT